MYNSQVWHSYSVRPSEGGTVWEVWLFAYVWAPTETGRRSRKVEERCVASFRDYGRATAHCRSLYATDDRADQRAF